MPVMIANAHNTGWLTSKDVLAVPSEAGLKKVMSDPQ
jgi:hypothetical protein